MAADADSLADPAAEPFDALVAHAHETHVVVVGAGAAGLVAALECAKVGLRVTLLEASERPGGAISAVELGGVRLDAGASCWSARGTALRAVVSELGLDGRVASPADARVWIAGLPGRGAAPVPDATALGIPANAWDESVRRLIGWRGAWRAYLDRLRPPLTIGTQRSLGVLVRSRMGAAVLDRLVAPLSVDGFGVHPDDIDVEVAAPALSPALTRTGSLGGAVGELVAGGAARPALESLDGGMGVLVDALCGRLAELGAEIRTGTRVSAIAARDDGRWEAAADEQEDGAHGEAAPLDPADVVIVATDEAPARRLLAPFLSGAVSAAPAAADREIVTLLVEAAAIDGAPRGAVVHAVPGSGRATGLVHATARWGWLARELGRGRHVLHVAFGAVGAPPATAGIDDTGAVRIAVAEASALLGVSPDALRLLGAHRRLFPLAPPASAMGLAERTSLVRGSLTGSRGLAVVGAWVAGSGLAQVAADAVEQAEAVRRAVLWGRRED